MNLGKFHHVRGSSCNPDFDPNYYGCDNYTRLDDEFGDLAQGSLNSRFSSRPEEMDDFVGVGTVVIVVQ